MLALVVAGATLVAGCGSGESRSPDSTDTASTAETPSQSPAPPSSTVSPPAKSRSGTVIKTADSDYGPMLFDRSGQAIYLFARETSRPECYGACAAAWPPVLAKGVPQASGNVRPALLDTTRRNDGSRQVTYAGHPLYFYAHEKPNQVLCHNVSEYGGLWLVVMPNGEPAA